MATKQVVMVRNPGKKKGRRRRRSVTIPITIVAGLLPGFSKIYQAGSGGGWRFQDIAREFSHIYLGINFDNNTWHPDWLMSGTIPILFGALAHYIANKLGVNRAIARAGIPIIRV